MIAIDASEVSPGLMSLFDLHMPTAVRCFAVLQGGNAGQILTDDPDCPRWGCVRETDDGSLYRGGAVDAAVLLDVVTALRQEGVVALGFRDGDPAVSLFPPSPNACAPCLEFDRPMGSSDLSPYLGQLPAGYEVQRMDRRLLESSPHHEGTVRRYGSVDSFLQKGIAVCLLYHGETVCEAYADMDIMGVRELGVTTQKQYRGQGFATSTCAHLIAACEEHGSHTYWDCAKLNGASAAVARKLGFRNEREYKLLAWFPPS